MEMVKDPGAKQNSTNVTDSSPQTCMVNRQNVQLEKELHTITDQDPMLEWDELMRGHVLGAVSIGYLTTQIIGGRVACSFQLKK